MARRWRPAGSRCALGQLTTPSSRAALPLPRAISRVERVELCPRSPETDRATSRPPRAVSNRWRRVGDSVRANAGEARLAQHLRCWGRRLGRSRTRGSRPRRRARSRLRRPRAARGSAAHRIPEDVQRGASVAGAATVEGEARAALLLPLPSSHRGDPARHQSSLAASRNPFPRQTADQPFRSRSSSSKRANQPSSHSSQQTPVAPAPNLRQWSRSKNRRERMCRP